MSFLSSISTQLSNIPRHKPIGGDDNNPHFFKIPQNMEINKVLQSILSLPHTVLIEQTANDNSKQLLKTIATYNSPDLLLSISTYSAYTSNLSGLLTDILNNRFNLNGNKYNEIKTCLHEAIMNAVLHGNLGMKSDFRTTKGLYKYQTEISKRLNLDIYKSRRVNIMVWNKKDHLQISVSDEGTGFSIANFKEENYTSPNGRGLMLIIKLSDSMWIGDDKRTLFMGFRHS